MSENIITLIRENNNYCSGSKISAELGISRAAVWKRISSLRKKGFVIEAVPSKGYRLVSTPDLSPDFIKAAVTGGFWKDVFVHDRVLSTNDLAMSLAAQGGLQAGTVIVADSQEKGKGRLGRIWVSPPGKNVYLSIVLKPELPTRDATMLTLLSAVACTHAVRNITNLPVRIKWPNDLILSGKKIGGILTEIRADIDKVSLAVIGVGINLNMRREDFNGIDGLATSIGEESGIRYSRSVVIIEMLKQFERFYGLFMENGKRFLLDEWKALSSTIGKTVRVVLGDEIITGVAEDIDGDGMLILNLGSGLRRQVSAGDVTLLR